MRISQFILFGQQRRPRWFIPFDQQRRSCRRIPFDQQRRPRRRILFDQQRRPHRRILFDQQRCSCRHVPFGQQKHPRTQSVSSEPKEPSPDDGLAPSRVGQRNRSHVPMGQRNRPHDPGGSKEPSPCPHVTSNDVAESAQECYTKRYVTGFGRLNREPPCFRVDTLSKGAVWL